MDNTKSPNVDGLKAHALHKKEATFKKVNDAIHQLVKAKERINFNSVAMESGVSKAYLYNNQEMRELLKSCVGNKMVYRHPNKRNGKCQMPVKMCYLPPKTNELKD